jgi:hypothetical protein
VRHILRRITGRTLRTTPPVGLSVSGYVDVGRYAGVSRYVGVGGYVGVHEYVGAIGG